MSTAYNGVMRKIIVIIFGLYITINCSTTCFGETVEIPSSPLLITEIMPNPKGADNDQEWVEIYNTTEQRVDLGNWKLDNGKIFTIPGGLSILPKSHFVLQGSNLKITLKNSNASISLLNPNGKTIQDIPYQKSIEAQSYSLTEIKTSTSAKYSWQWTIPTKGKQNQILYSISGEIDSPPQIDEDFYFTVNFNDKKIRITFSEEKYNFDLLQTLLNKGVQASFILEKSSNKYILQDFKITKQATPEENPSAIRQEKHWEYFLLIPIILLTLFLIKITSSPSSFDRQARQAQRASIDDLR